MKRWHTALGKEVETPAVDAFLNEIVSVCRQHKMFLSHEDGHGAFEVNRILQPSDVASYDTSDWILAAHIAR